MLRHVRIALHISAFSEHLHLNLRITDGSSCHLTHQKDYHDGCTTDNCYYTILVISRDKLQFKKRLVNAFIPKFACVVTCAIVMAFVVKGYTVGGFIIKDASAARLAHGLYSFKVK